MYRRFLPLTLLLTSVAGAQDDLEQRVLALEEAVVALGLDLEDLQLSDTELVSEHQVWNLGPSASKVYAIDQGLSVGGYGEARYQHFKSGTDEFDFYRNVLYMGYKFNDQWVLNTELEFEHVSETFLEFAYLDYLHSENFAVRSGLMLLPMGLVNEYHESTTYLTANRSMTETSLIPSTWRENGLGVLGSMGEWDYKLYLVNGMDGSEFTNTGGLRSGRQKGAEATAEDFALAASFAYSGINGVMLGFSGYSGDSGQNVGTDSLGTQILEAHAEYKSGPVWARALVAQGTVDDRTAGDLDLDGWYVEVGYDLLHSNEKQSLYPYFRLEDFSITEGGATTRDDSATTLGLHYKPIDQVAFKLDHTDLDDVTTFLMGYSF